MFTAIRQTGTTQMSVYPLSQRVNPELFWLRVVMLILVGLALDSGPSHGERTRPIRIGALTDSWGVTPHIAGLRDGLANLGYQENQDFYLGIRFTKGNRDILLTAAHELIQAGAELLFVDSIVTAQAAQQATTQIPIIFTSVEDPVGSGLIESYAQPGGNTTGVASLDIELGPKRLQIFQELLPKLRRVLFLYDQNDLYSAEAARLYKNASRRLGIEWVEKIVRSQAEAKTILSEVHRHQIDGILTPRCCTLNIPGLILEATSEQRIPTMFHTAAYWIKEGGFASYGPDLYTSGHQAARIVEKIIKGADPANTPVEVNSQIKFTINLKTAKALDLVISPEVLSHADEVTR